MDTNWTRQSKSLYKIIGVTTVPKQMQSTDMQTITNQRSDEA